MKKRVSKILSLIMAIVMVVGIIPITNLVLKANAYSPRTTEPASSNSYFYGSNPYSKGQCTWYAWGRAYEILGTKPYTFSGNANKWYGQGYACGSTPRIGSIMVTQKSTNEGHVAVVEELYSDGTMLISEYNWNKSLGFETNKLSQSAKTRGKHTVLGYIYLLNDDTAPPVISNVAYQKNAAGYLVTCNVSDNVGVTRVTFPTWTDYNGQDDIKWVDGNLSADGKSAWFQVNRSDHNFETGTYITHIYAHDMAGNESQVGINVWLDPDTAAPVISNVKVLNFPSGYYIECDVTDDTGVLRVAYPSWTDNNGQDDIVWHEGTLSGTKSTCWIPKESHNNETGMYTTHIYAYDCNNSNDKAGTYGIGNIYVGDSLIEYCGYTDNSGNWIADTSATPTVSGTVQFLFIEYDKDTNYYIDIYLDGNKVEANKPSDDGRKTYKINTLDLTNGTHTIEAKLYDSSACYTDSKTFNVSNTNKYTITYNANGGSGAPSAQTKTHGTPITLSSQTPTGKTYTVTFNGNGGTVSKASKTYTQYFKCWNTKADGTGTSYASGETYSANGNVTLYAQYFNPDFSLDIPTKSGKFFAGWYDSLATDSNGQPTGKKYDGSSVISKNVTLYAFWSDSAERKFGDAYYDGVIDTVDLLYISREISGLTSDGSEDFFFADINADGIVDDADIDLISAYLAENITEKEFCLYNPQKIVIYTKPKTEYKYGEEFDKSGLSVIGFYPLTYYNVWMNEECPNPEQCPSPQMHCHELNEVDDEYLIVSGYNPYQSGYQDLTVHFYQFSTTLRVYVAPQEYKVTYNANGGTGAPSAQTKIHGTNLTLSTDKPSRTGYTFNGWNTKADGSGTSYASGATFTVNENTTLYAQWKINTYIVSYTLNGGSVATANPTSYNVTTEAFTLNNPTKVGYTFAGWTGTGLSTATKSVTVANGSTGNRSYTANWTANTYTIAFNGNGSTSCSMSNLAMTYGTAKSLTANAFTRTGYTFNGWNTKADGSGTAYTDKKSVNNLTSSNGATVILYAQWKVDTYTISYTLNGGNVATANPTSYNVATAAFTLNNPTKTGYTFAGWTGTGLSSATKTVTVAKGSTGNRSYTANWTANSGTKYVVNHYQMNVNGSGYSLKETENKTGATASSVTLANLKKTYTGFTFEGGKGTTSATATKPSAFDTTATVLADGTRVINLYYSRNKYALTLSKGTGISAVSGAGTYYYGQSVTIDATVSSGYTWSKWSDNNTTKKATMTMPANALTLTANATLNTYTISYDLDGGSVATANPTSYNVTTASFTLNNPTKTGYTFAGWTGTGLSSATKTVTVAKGSTGNRSYTANWTANTYTVTYNANGGSGAPSSQTKTYGTDLVLSSTKPTRSYTVNLSANGGTVSTASKTLIYTFNGWNTKADGTGTNYVSGGTYKNNSAVTLYAKWTAPAAYVLPAPTRTGYTFTGWNTKSDGSGTNYPVGSSYTASSDVTLYAQWTEIALTSISVKTNPSVVNYYVGDTLNTSGLTLTANYSDGSTKTISNGFACAPTALTTAGTQKITVTYGGKTTSFNVTVENVLLASIAIKTLPSNMTYYVGDSLDTTGLTLTVTYNNGTTKTVNGGFTCTPEKLETAGTQKITVTYGDKSTSFNVEVKAVEISGISIANVPETLSYYVGDTLSTKGLTILVSYNNGTTKTITSGFTCTPTTLNTGGTQKITVTYGGKTATFNVSVATVKVTELEIVTAPNKTSYKVGDKFDPTGLTMNAVNSKGETIVVTDGFVCTPEILDKAGTQVVTISYGGKSVMITVVVAEAQPDAYTVKFIADGEIIGEALYEVGKAIVKPSDPKKDGYKFIGWTPDVPYAMPAYDLTFTAVFEKSYICPDCGKEILGEDEINAHIAAENASKIKTTINIKNNSGSKTIKYGETLRLTAITTDMPANAKIYWYIDDVKKGEGETFNVSFDNGTKTVEVKVVDSSGNVLKNASGNEIKDSESVTVKGGFFQKIISFFKNLFGMNRTVVQTIFRFAR